MCIGMGGVTCVKSLQSPEALLSASPLEAASALASGRLGDLQLAVECMDLGRNIEDAGVSLVVAGDLGRQAPVVGTASQVHGLVVGRRLARDDIDEPHGEWLSRGVANVGGGGEQVVLEDGVPFLSEGAEGEGDRAIAQFDVAHLAHNIVGVGDDEVWEAAVVFFEPFGALCVGVTSLLVDQ